MNIFIYSAIIAGALLMVTNIVRYAYFLITTRDVLSSGIRRDRIRKVIALILLVFFLIGYLFIAIFSKPDVMMAMILLGGSTLRLVSKS